MPAEFVRAVLEKNPGTKFVRIARLDHGTRPLVVRLVNRAWYPDKSKISRQLQAMADKSEHAQRLRRKNIRFHHSFESDAGIGLHFTPMQGCGGGKCKAKFENAEKTLLGEQKEIEALKKDLDELGRLAKKPETLRGKMDAAIRKMTEEK